MRTVEKSVRAKPVEVWTGYRGLFRSELDDAAIADIRLALTQGQPLGSERFSEIMCAAVGVRRAKRKPGRPKLEQAKSVRVEDQADFGF